MQQYLWFIPLGFLIGAYGTLIGAGGGFILVPLLLVLYPKESPQVITSISLAVVFFNALSGSVAYAGMRRIDYKSGLLFSIATIPGAILGALTTGYMPRRAFDLVLGLLMVAASAFLIVRPKKKPPAGTTEPHPGLLRILADADGTTHTFSYKPSVGVGLSLAIGYVSSLLGIGGGVIHVPALVHLLNFPVHIATATSHFVLMIMALTGTLVHVATGAFERGVRRTILLAMGVLLGAQLGALLSTRVRGAWIIRGLAVGLGFLGIRIMLAAFWIPAP